MARRKKTSTADDLLELVAMLPWWVGVLLALASYFALHSIASQLVVAPMQPERMGAMVTQSIWKSLATVGQYPRRPPKVLHLWPPKLLHPGRGDLTH